MSLSRDQKRRKKLAERQQRQAQRHGRPHEASALPRDRIAAVVHRAVCTFANDGGFGHCAHYAVAGSTLISMVTGKMYLPQAGTLQIFCDGDEGMMMDASQGGIRAGEFHSWIVGPVNFGNPGKHEMPADMEVIDFSSRHYRRYVEEQQKIEQRIAVPGGVINILSAERLTWRLPEPPAYIWTPFEDLPRWVRISADKESTEHLVASIDEFEPLMTLVVGIWKNGLR